MEQIMYNWWIFQPRLIPTFTKLNQTNFGPARGPDLALPL